MGFGRSNHSLILFKVVYPSRLGEESVPLNYKDFFQPHLDLVLCVGTENVCRDFCLFSPDERHLIVASAESSSAHTTDPNQPFRRYAHSLTALSSLDEIRFHLVDIEAGRVVDRLKFSRDYILLSNHAGVSMCGYQLAIVSLQNQMIRTYKVEGGQFCLTNILGHVLHTDEELGAFAPSEDPLVDETTQHSRPLLGIRQRLFAFLYRRALEQPRPMYAVRLIYTNWQILETLCMARAQFLDSKHLLIRLCCPESLGSRTRASTDGGLQSTAFFIVYNLVDTQIKSFHRSTSVELYERVRDYNDFVRIISQVDETAEEGIGLSWQTCPASDMWERQIWDRNVQLLAASKPTEGERYAAKRMLLTLPCPPQSFSESPYVDPSIFRFDDRSISASDRQRSASEYPVRFFSRLSDRFCFKLNSAATPPDASNQSTSYRSKKYVQWVFHPYLPLVLSSQHTLIRSMVVNIHYRPPSHEQDQAEGISRTD